MSTSRALTATIPLSPTTLRAIPSTRCPGCLQPLQHIRTKKKSAKPRTTLPVRLLQDVPEWGRKGTVVPVPVGQMRNRFYPQHLASYIPYTEQNRMRRTNVSIERDTTFGRDPPPQDTNDPNTAAAAAAPLRAPEPQPIELNLLPPAEAHALLNDIVPPTLEFHRTPISSPHDRRLKTANPDPHQLTPQAQAITEAPPVGVTPRQTADNIYGSVTTSEIATSVKALIFKRGFAGRVILPDEDIRFVHLGGTGGRDDEGMTADRVKKLGVFEYEIRVKGVEGAVEPLKRNVRVLSDDQLELADQGSSLPPPPPSRTGPDTTVVVGGGPTVGETRATGSA